MYKKLQSFKTIILINLVVVATILTGFSFVISNLQVSNEEILIKAEQFQFSPSIIKVGYNTNLTIKVLSMDIKHGFQISRLHIDLKIDPLTMQTITIMINKVGTFKIACSIPCGSFHPYMTAQLKIQPNLPLISSILTLIVIGISVEFWNIQNRRLVGVNNNVNKEGEKK